MRSCSIVFNAGSSSLKFSLYEKEKLELVFDGEIEDIPDKPFLWVKDKNGKEIYRTEGFASGHNSAIKTLLGWVESHSDGLKIVAAGHRVVHGGKIFSDPVVVNKKVLEQLKIFIPLAPLHQPHNIEVIEAFASLHPDIPQVACFDTGFHRTQPEIAELFALPKKYAEEGIIRYGFHGLSYQYIASVLPEYAEEKARERVIIAHLGNGASMCAMKDLKSVATTMGFTALDGLMMGTRCGDLDPGVVLYLLEEKGMSTEEVTNLLYKESGLKGISGISYDMEDLLKSDKPEAKEAIDLFCYQAARQLSGLIPTIGGLDILVFTAGIGQHAPLIRKKICEKLDWLGVELDLEQNDANEICISTKDSKIDAYVIPTDEEKIIASMTMAIIGHKGE